MRTGARLGLRIATAVAFGATAALAVTLNGAGPVHATLAAEKGPNAPHATTTSSPARTPPSSPVQTPRCAACWLRISVDAGGDYLQVHAIQPGS